MPEHSQKPAEGQQSSTLPIRQELDSTMDNRHEPWNSNNYATKWSCPQSNEQPDSPEAELSCKGCSCQGRGDRAERNEAIKTVALQCTHPVLDIPCSCVEWRPDCQQPPASYECDQTLLRESSRLSAPHIWTHLHHSQHALEELVATKESWKYRLWGASPLPQGAVAWDFCHFLPHSERRNALLSNQTFTSETACLGCSGLFSSSTFSFFFNLKHSH
jgi:hypothetical protein